MYDISYFRESSHQPLDNEVAKWGGDGAANCEANYYRAVVFTIYRLAHWLNGQLSNPHESCIVNMYDMIPCTIYTSSHVSETLE